MYKVKFKSKLATGSWVTNGSYATEASALQVAASLAKTKFMVQVVHKSGNVIWSH